MNMALDLRKMKLCLSVRRWIISNMVVGTGCLYLLFLGQGQRNIKTSKLLGALQRGQNHQ